MADMEASLSAVPGTPPPSIEVQPKRWLTVGLLAGLAGISFLDKLILAVVAQPLSQSLHLSDLQLGLLIGPAFAILYALVGLPVAYLVDTRNRRPIVFFGAFVWSTATFCSGF